MSAEPAPTLLSARLRGVHVAAFRLVTLYLGLGLVDIVLTFAQGAVVTSVDVHAQNALVEPLMELFGAQSGEGWVFSFALLVLLGGGIKVALAVRVWRRRAAPLRGRVLLLFLGFGGLFASVAQPLVGSLITQALARVQGVEAVAAFAVATNVASMVAMVLNFFVLSGFVAVLFQHAPDERAEVPTAF